MKILREALSSTIIRQILYSILICVSSRKQPKKAATKSPGFRCGGNQIGKRLCLKIEIRNGILIWPE